MLSYLLFWTFIYNLTRFISYNSKKKFLKDWSSNKDSRTLSFYSVSTVHSLIMSTVPIYFLYKSYTNDTLSLVKPFNENEIKLVNLSLSYFIWDFYYIFLHSDYLFLIHHTLSIIYMLVFRNYPMSNLFMISILLPEITTPFLNLWTLGKIKKYNYFNRINSIFTFYYIFIRIFCIIPFNVYAFIQIYNSHLIPRYITYSLAGLTCLYCFGNIMWSNKLVKGYNKWLKNSKW